MFRLYVAIVTLWTVHAVPAANDAYALPHDLLIGAGTAAFQSEGAWDTNGKAESMVDHLFHTGKLENKGFKDGHLHDGGSDSYHRYKEDVAMAAELKLQMYRFSISWARVLPEADASKPNAEGVQFYHNLIDEILAHKMTPLVTLYHFDHPQLLEDEFKGWMNRKMVDKFREYASFIFAEYGKKVKLWTSLNEPNAYCTYWLNLQLLTEMLKPEDVENIYPCYHHFLLAHGEASRALKQSGNQGMIGFSVSSAVARPNSTLPEDAYATEAFNFFENGLLLHPIVFGDYPDIVKRTAKEKLPVFTEEEKSMLQNSSDYIGLNVYYDVMVSYRDPNTPKTHDIFPTNSIMDRLDFVNVGFRGPNGDTLDALSLDMIAPDAMRTALAWTWFQYKMPIIITENGLGAKNTKGLEDHRRAVYHSAFLRSMLSAVNELGVRVIAYAAWSLIDSFEYSSGYDSRFGLVHVDIGGSYNRTLKDSSTFWIELAERRTVPIVDMPSSASATSMAWLLLVVGCAGITWQ